jgi:hypothetical protein
MSTGKHDSLVPGRERALAEEFVLGENKGLRHGRRIVALPELEQDSMANETDDAPAERPSTGTCRETAGSFALTYTTLESRKVCAARL